ncbi:PIG-L family deacetylase [Roseateles sp. SL47]|uniref:PIG-L deacetylase family protein n=1 Tax=Roseateles sp. SL47 TaxID=2995138 RepID=UPI0022719F26|nr:PIG-L deacetylase family protein [Roseateles sp. SL47]WAC72259.1 PIG-L family deacetylase [Roseateles sp. SL47]
MAALIDSQKAALSLHPSPHPHPHPPTQQDDSAASHGASSEADRDTPRIEGEGTCESEWWSTAHLHQCPSIRIETLLPAERRLVVVAPHPDDEVLGCGGLLSMALQRQTIGTGPLLIGVTDGEASHPDSTRWTPSDLVRQRGCERARGLAALGGGTDLRLLRLADGGVADAEQALVQKLAPLLRPTDVVVTTWRGDGHPDHQACGRACAGLVGRIGFSFWEMPVWMWHWAVPADRRVPWHQMVQLPLTAVARQRKRVAIEAHRSQLDPDPGRAPVLPPSSIDRLLRPAEFFFRGETA